MKPDGDEKRALHGLHGIDENMIAAALDPDEVSRFDVGSDVLKIIWKSPISYSGNDSFLFDVTSVGIFLVDGRLVLISSEKLQFHEKNTVGDVHCETLFDTVRADRRYIYSTKVLRMQNELYVAAFGPCISVVAAADRRCIAGAVPAVLDKAA